MIRLSILQQIVDEATSLTHLCFAVWGALSLHVSGKETQVAHERTMVKSVNFGSGFCDKLYHCNSTKCMQPHPFPLEVKVDQCEVA